jgi:hypothetical protein
MKRRSKVSGKPAKAQGRNAARPKRRTAQHEPTVAFAAGELGESPGTIRELNEAREQLQAISEVLRALGSSHGQLEPIFQSMLKNATRLCEAKFGALYLRETDGLRVSVMHGAPAAFVEERRRNPVVRPRPGTILADALATMRAVQIADIKTEADASSASGTTGAALAQLGGARTVLAVPMVKEKDVVGALTLPARKSVHSPTSKSSWSRTSQPKPSSPSRTRGCSMNSGNRWRSRRRLPMFSRSSVAPLSTCRQFSIR